MKKYIFRVDDVSWNMNYDNWTKLKDVFFKYNVKPIVGVIPDNKDEKLVTQGSVSKTSISRDGFWEEMRLLQRNEGWSIAMHGLDHVYVTENGGILNRNPRSEFAGLPYDKQNKKVVEGICIMNENEINIDAFMAPGHSFDEVTLRVLLENGINCVTDGNAAFPYIEDNMIFIPQQWPWPHGGLWGIETVALHINPWDDKRFIKLDRFLHNNKQKVISFLDAKILASQYSQGIYGAINKTSKCFFPVKKRIYVAGAAAFRRVFR